MMLTLFVLVLLVLVLSASAEEEHKRNHYEALGVEPEAEAADIKKAFRRLALELHPDKISNNATEVERQEAHDFFLDIQDAYFTLSDVERRRKYDLERQDITYDIY